jgi:sugar (pentulose or hexulose) kinase
VIAAGVFTDLREAVTAAVATRDRYEPDPRQRRAYDDAYARYITLFDAVRPMFAAGRD